MQKLLILLLILFSSYGLADSTFKPVIIEYQANPQATMEYRISYDLALYTLPPKSFLPNGIILYFDKDRSRALTYHPMDEKIEGVSQKQALLEALNLAPASKDTKLFKQIYNNENSQVIEVKTNNELYRVFVIPTLKKYPEQYFNVYLVATDPNKEFIHYLQFKGFTVDEVGQQLATISKGAK